MISWTLFTGWMLMAAPADFSAPLRAPGEKAAASSMHLTSDGRQLLLEVEVVDTTPAPAKDEVHSDHVEVWFSLEDLAASPTRFVTAGQGRLFTVNGGDNPKQLDRSIRKLARRDDDTSEEGRCEASEREARESLGKPPSRRVRAFFGLVHLGLFPDGRPAVLYDGPLYAAAGLAPSLAPGDVSYEVQKTARGYHLRAKIQPGGLVFVPRSGVQALRARVDVIDAGAPGAREVLRSSHPAPKWGEPSTFQLVKLAKPLELQLVAGVPEVSKFEDGELTELPSHFMRVGEEWWGVSAHLDTPRSYSNRYCLEQSGVEEVQEYLFLQWKLGPATPFAGADTVRIPMRKATGENDWSQRGVAEAARSGELLLFRGPEKTRAAWVQGTTKLGFRFGDGAPGALVEHTGFILDIPMGGAGGAAEETSLTRWRLAESGPTSDVLLTWGDSISHGSEDLAPVPRADEYIREEPWPGYTWQQPGQKLRVTFSEDTWVDLSWNAKDGSGVTAHAEKPKEEEP